jgi:hypothetical protein
MEIPRRMNSKIGLDFAALLLNLQKLDRLTFAPLTYTYSLFILVLFVKQEEEEDHA